MKKPENKESRGKGFFPEEEDYSAKPAKAGKVGKTQKRIRLQDLDLDDE